MRFTILSYNLLFNLAYPKIGRILNKYQPAFVCFQEMDTSKENLKEIEKYGYFLADYSNCFIKHGKIYSIATFYNKKHFRLVDSLVDKIPRTLYDFVATITHFLGSRPIPRTFLKNRFKHNITGKKIDIFNIHLTPQTTNGARLKQLKKILDLTKGTENPIIVVGDYNYLPYRRKRLEKLIRKYGLEEATKNVPFTFSYTKNSITYGFIDKIVSKVLGRFFKPKFDYIFYKKLSVITSKKIDDRYSDHYPVLATFEY